MGKAMNDTFADTALDWIKNNCDLITACSAQPATYAEASSTYKLADVSVDSGDFTGPTDGDVSGRKLTINQESAIPIDDSGSATHIALCSTAGSLLYTTTCSNTYLIAGNTLTINSWDIEIADPS